MLHKKKLIVLFLISLSSQVQAENIIPWDSNQNYIWHNIYLSNGIINARFGYQIKMWADNFYPYHPSNMLTATPFYLDVYNVNDEDTVKAQLTICAGSYDSQRIPGYKVSCFDSNTFTLKADGNQKHWIEINSDFFNIVLDNKLKDVFLTTLNHPPSGHYFYYESYQYIKLWVNNVKVIDQKIDMLAPIKK